MRDRSFLVGGSDCGDVKGIKGWRSWGMACEKRVARAERGDRGVSLGWGSRGCWSEVLEGRGLGGVGRGVLALMTLGRKQKTCAGVGGVRSRRNFGVAGTRRDQDLLLKSPAAKPQPFVFDCVGADLRSLPGYRSGHRQTPSVRRPKGGNKMVVPLGRKARTGGGSPRDPSRPVPQPHLGHETATGASPHDFASGRLPPHHYVAGC